MRFLSGNILGSYNNQESITASSGDPLNAFSDTILYNYLSEGQNTDGDTVILQQDFTDEQSFDTLAVLDCNFDDFAILTANGGSFTDITSLATLQISSNGKHRIYKFATAQTFTEIRFEINNTIVADEEKSCGAIMAFTEIGSIKRFDAVTTTGKINKKVINLENGGVAVLYKGSTHWDFVINTDLVSVQSEIDIASEIQARTEDFFFWLNDGYEGKEKVKQEPYRFQDFIRCAYTGDNKPKFYKNYLNNYISNQIKFSQTSKIDYFDPEL